MNEPIYLTQTGKVQIEEELKKLTGPDRAAIALRLKHAIEMGDLSENADYKAAKEDQGFLEGRIQELETILLNAVLIDEADLEPGVVQIGKLVSIQEEGEAEETYEIVGATEANPRERKISYESPIGSALIGKQKGEIAEVILPNGSTILFKILKVTKA